MNESIRGKLSGRTITIPDVDAPPMPAIASSGVVYSGPEARHFGEIDSARGYPDVRSFRRKFGLVIPATNTSMEHELWSIIFRNQGPTDCAASACALPTWSLRGRGWRPRRI